MKNILKNPLAWIVVLLLLAGAGYGAVKFGRVDLSRFQNSAMLENKILPSEGLMAQVNGEAIQKALFEIRFAQRKSFYETQGATLKDQDMELIRQQVLDDMINEILLFQYAKKQGITAADQAIQEEYQKIVAQFPSEEEFQKHLTSQKASPEDVRFAITLQVIVQQIINQKLGEQPIEILEEEMRQVYDKAVANGAQVPPFEAAKPDIENQLRQQKIAQIMNALIDQLRAESSIQILG